MRLPKHLGLVIQHNQHLLSYASVEEWLAEHEEGVDIQDGDRAEILRTGEVWCIYWWPRTPVGHCRVVAPTLERALELAQDDE